MNKIIIIKKYTDRALIYKAILEMAEEFEDEFKDEKIPLVLTLELKKIKLINK